MYHGDIRLEETIDVKFTTRSFSTGVPTALAGTPVISAYPGNSLTQLTAGITLSVDFDTVVGLNNVRVVATAANGYATATNYALVITTGTVGGVSVVGEVVGSFSIEARSALMPTTAARTLDITATGEAGIDLDNTVGTLAKTTDITGFNDLSAAQVNAEVDAALDTAIPGVPTADSVNQRIRSMDLLTEAAGTGDLAAILTDTADMQPKLGAPAGASVSADVAAIKAETATILADTDDIQTRLPAALVGGRIDANAGAISGDAVAADNLEQAFDDAAGTVPWLGIIDQGTAQSATATTVVLRAASAFANDTLIGAVIMVLGSTQGYWQTRLITDNDLATDTVTVDAWTVTPSGTITYKIGAGPAASLTSPPFVDVRQWNGAAVAAPTVAGVPEVDVTHVGGVATTATLDTIKTDTAAILVDTAVIGAAGAGLTAVPWNAAWDAEVQSEVDDALVVQRLDELLNADSDIDGLAPPTVGSVVHELLTKSAASFTYDQTTDSLEAIRDTAPLGTAMRGTDNAALASVATEARLAELDTANLPTDVANVKTDTAAILLDTGTDGVVLNAAGLATDAVNEIRDAILNIVTGTADAGSTATTIVDAERTEATTDYWQHGVVEMTSGANIGQSRRVTAFNFTTDTITVAPAFKSAVAAGDTYRIIHVLADALRPTTEANETVDVAAGGEVGIDLDNTVGTLAKTTDITGFNDLSAAQVNAEVDTALDTAIPGVPTADSVNQRVRSMDLLTEAAGAGDLAAILTDTADMQPKLGAPAGASISADIAAVKTDTAAILVDTGTTLDTKLNDIQGATFSSATDSLEAIRDRGDAAWTTGAGGSPPDLLQNTTIATLASQTSFTLTAGSADNSAYVGATAVVTDSATSTQKAVGLISAYTGATKTVTLVADPGIFTMAVGDTIDIVAAPKSLPAQLAGVAGGLPTDTDVNGAVRIVDGIGAREINTNAGAVALVDTVTTLTGHTAQTGDSFARLGAPAGVSVSADVAAIKADTAAILVDTADMQPKLGAPAGASISADIAAIEAQTDDIGVAGAGLTAIPWNAAWDAEVQSEVDDALIAQRLDEIVNADSDIDGLAPPAVGSVVHELLTKSAASFTYDQTTDSLEAIRDTAPLGTAMRGTDSAALASVCTETRLSELDVTNIPAQISGVQIDTNDIQTRLPATLVSGRMDANTSAIDDVVTAAARLRRSTQGIVFGTIGAASTTTSIVTSALDPAAAVADQFKGRIVTFLQGTTTANLKGQSTDITASTVAGVLTVTALTTAPVSGDVFVIT